MISDLVSRVIEAIASSLLGGLMVGIFMFRLEERRAIRDRRREDYREALNWDTSEKKGSLRHFDLTEANLSGHNFVKADFESATLDKSKIWGADFSNGNLRMVSFRKARLVGVKFCNAVMLLADFSNARIERREYTDIDQDFKYIPDFSGATLSRAIFRNALIDGVVFQDATLISADFTNAQVNNCDFTGADLRKSNWRKVKEVTNCNCAAVTIDDSSNFPERIWQEIQSQNSQRE